MTRYVSDALSSLFLQGLNRASENNHSIELNGKVHAKCSILDLSHGKLKVSVLPTTTTTSLFLAINKIHFLTPERL